MRRGLWPHNYIDYPVLAHRLFFLCAYRLPTFLTFARFNVKSFASSSEIPVGTKKISHFSVYLDNQFKAVFNCFRSVKKLAIFTVN